MASEYSDEEVQFRVIPYQFEPLLDKGSGIHSDQTSEEGESTSSSDSEERGEVPQVEDWCSCNHCSQMSSALESRCCHSFMLCEEKGGELECVTLHEGFIVNCLNTHVLELDFYEYLDNYGPVGDEEPIHELYRYIAYRRFTRWIWHRLGKKNRKVLPSCVVTAIRNTFPSQEYTAFKYPTDY